MGRGDHGGIKGTVGADAAKHTVADNLASTEKKFPLSEAGYFGRKSGKGNTRTSTRQIESPTPVKTSREFFHLLANHPEKIGRIRDNNGRPKGIMATMKDGTVITYRKRMSSDGSPVVDINVTKVADGRVRTQKIHFVKGDGQ